MWFVKWKLITWLAGRWKMLYWYCGSCGHYSDYKNKVPCKCSPAPWHLGIHP